MIDYTVNMIARSEHELMKQSLPRVSEFDGRGQSHQPGWASKQIGKLFQSVGSTLASVGERLNHEQEIPCEGPLADNA